jgi:hypothetical protein
MAIYKNENELIYEMYINEGKIKNALIAGALSVAPLYGAADSHMDNVTYQSNYNNIRVLNNDTFVELWAKNYQTSDDDTKKERAKNVLKQKIVIPKEAEDAINVAVYIFSGDMGVSSNIIYDILLKTGWVESRYMEKQQRKGGPACSYWQVELNTAFDCMEHGRGLFGPKFKSVFGEKYTNNLLNLDKNNPKDREYLRNELIKNSNLGASFSAIWWLRKAGKQLNTLKR